MTDQPLDPRMEKLIALLYGELSAEEEQEVRRQIDQDSELQGLWEELTGTRELLGEWDVAEEAPAFIFVDDPTESTEGPDQVGRWKNRLRGFFTATPWAIAAAAVVVAVLAANDFRIEKSHGSYAFRFGPSSKLQAAGSSSPVDLGVSGGTPLAGNPNVQQASQQVDTMADMLATPGMSPFLTREEFETYAAGFTKTMVALLDQYGSERDEEVSVLLNAAFSDFVRMQTTEYRELRNRIEAAQLGIAEEQLRTNVQVDYLMKQNVSPGLMAPVSHSPADRPEGVEK